MKEESTILKGGIQGRKPFQVWRDKEVRSAEADGKGGKKDKPSGKGEKGGKDNGKGDSNNHKGKGKGKGHDGGRGHGRGKSY